ncbi:hypothetical protein [Streptomyces brevispora]|uniref:Uncharacterized protein n=1 Tax=Streptomyces brevispora TaxID=887462 RepID=A0A561UXA9_9ACTN|nr:hypothetical protein [Streptomyces brevispora]TWG04008.1 hypothetical protein FHX80_112449 [Streptomyces brevispora]WSC14968.1 hypothetical protein OIE64_20430 [Streptomyces brevispora]
MEILITVVVVVGMIAVVALAIHLLNGRHRHRHLAAGPLDHGLAVFRTPPAGGRGQDAPPPPDSR